jgi:hypothetical protein
MRRATILDPLEVFLCGTEDQPELPQHGHRKAPISLQIPDPIAPQRPSRLSYGRFSRDL